MRQACAGRIATSVFRFAFDNFGSDLDGSSGNGVCLSAFVPTLIAQKFFQPTVKTIVKVTSRIVNGKVRKCYRATAKGRTEVEEVIERLSFLMRKVFR